MGLFEKMMGHAREFSRATGLSDTDVKSAGRLSPCEDGLREELGRRAEACTTVLRFALLFSGDVQGVGFRWTNQSLAHERHLVGWVKNLPDGTVQMEIQGAPRAWSPISSASMPTMRVLAIEYGSKTPMSCLHSPRQCL